MPLWHYRNNRTLIRLSRVEGTEGRERRLIELVRHSSVAEGAQIETRPKPGWCFDLFCLCFVPDPPYVLADNQSCLPFDFDLVPLPSLSLSLSLFLSFSFSLFFLVFRCTSRYLLIDRRRATRLSTNLDKTRLSDGDSDIFVEKSRGKPVRWKRTMERQVRGDGFS